MRIVFMGTPAFAVPSLRALLDGGYDVAAAITQPDRPSGRGHRQAACPVKELAASRGVRVLQFERVSRQEGLEALRALKPELFVTAAFGQILSRKVLDIPPRGTVNVHASLLPKYRGPAPINWCLIEGETATGVTTMLTDAGVDTGDLLLSRRTHILPEETAGELTDRLAVLGAELLIETLRRLEAGDCAKTPQDEAAATRHPMLEKAHGRIDWSQSAGSIVNLIRGVTPWPGAWTTYEGGVLKILRAHAAQGEGTPGRVLMADDKAGLLVACGEGALAVEALQAPGTRPMEAAAYLRGHPMNEGRMLGQEAD